MTDKDYCLSSYMAFRFIEDDDKDFFDGMCHHNMPTIPDSLKTGILTADEIALSIESQLDQFKDSNKGIR